MVDNAKSIKRKGNTKNGHYYVQAFADDVFRVFANHHPKLELIPINTNISVKKMISRTTHSEELFFKSQSAFFDFLICGNEIK